MQVRMVSVESQLSERTSENMEVPAGTQFTSLCWSPGGQLLAAACSNGALRCGLGSLPAIAAAATEHYACLSTLMEVTVYDVWGSAIDSVPLKFTPHFLALSSTVLAAGMNNQIVFYSVDTDFGSDCDTARTPRELKVHIYDEGSAERVAVNDTLAVALIGGRPVVQRILDNDADALVPYKGQDVTTFVLTDHFLIIGTSGGLLQHYSVHQGPLAPLNEFRHTRNGQKAGVTGIWAPQAAVHLVFTDDSNRAYLFSAVDDQVRRFRMCTPDSSQKLLGLFPLQRLLGRCTSWCMRS
jgi:hypothetical protein